MATAAPETTLQPVGGDALPLRERGQGQRQGQNARRQDQAQVDGQDEPRPGLQPGVLLQADEEEGRQQHDRGGVEDARDGGLGDGVEGGGAGFAERGWRRRRRGGGRGIRGVDVDALADLLGAHEEDVEGAGAGDGGEGHQAAEDRAGRWAQPSQARDHGVQADGYGARGRYGEEVRFAQLPGGEGRGFVGVGAVDGHVEGLVGDLPEEGPPCTEIRGEHAGGHDEVGDDEAGHAEGEEDRLARVWM